MLQKKCDQMISLLTEMIGLIDDERWRQNLSNARAHIQTVDMDNLESVRVAANVVMGMYGGMGSLNDLVESAEFSACVNELYDLAKEIKLDVYQGFSDQDRKDGNDE
jgi:hypothetical protein